MRRNRNAKIVATLGPSSRDRAVLNDLFEAGADVFRLNFSHGSHDDHRRTYNTIRELEQEHDRPIGILQDLQGPKLRVGRLKNGAIHLTRGERFRLDLDETEGDNTRAPLPHPEVFEVLETETPILLDDGKLRLIVKECGPDYADCEVETGGRCPTARASTSPAW